MIIGIRASVRASVAASFLLIILLVLVSLFFPLVCGAPPRRLPSVAASPSSTAPLLPPLPICLCSITLPSLIPIHTLRFSTSSPCILTLAPSIVLSHDPDRSLPHSHHTHKLGTLRCILRPARHRPPTPRFPAVATSPIHQCFFVRPSPPRRPIAATTPSPSPAYAAPSRTPPHPRPISPTPR